MNANLIVATAMMALVAEGAAGQDYPNRPIRIVTASAGSGSDTVARVVAQAISGPLGQGVIVENRPSNLTGEIAMKALPDGYSMLVEGNSFWLLPLMQKTPYDVLRDFSPLTQALAAPNVLVVHPSVQVNSVSELIALAKSKPGALNYGSSTTGSTNHLAAELFRILAGINIVHVPYKGVAQALTGVVAGEVQLMYASATSAAPFIKSGKLKALAVTSALPSPLLPGLPTVASSGLLGYELVSRTGLFASGKPPKPIVNRLTQEIVRALNNREVREAFLRLGAEPVSNDPETFIALIKSEVIRMGKVIREAGIKVN